MNLDPKEPIPLTAAQIQAGRDFKDEALELAEELSNSQRGCLFAVLLDLIAREAGDSKQVFLERILELERRLDAMPAEQKQKLLDEGGLA